MAPHDMKNVVEKARKAAVAAGGDGDNILVCERGASFGYNNLVSDMRSLAIMRETGCPVVFDATHSVQLPGGQGTSSGGQREHVPVLARAAVAAGVAGLFMERTRTRPKPCPTAPSLAARSDGRPARNPRRTRFGGKGKGLCRGGSMKPVVFVHTNHKQKLGALVSAHSFRRNTRDPEAFEVRLLEAKDYPQLKEAGRTFRRAGHVRAWDPDDLQSFTPLRFAVPDAMGHQGVALVVDPDVFAVGDAAELFVRDRQGKAIWARRAPRPQ